MNASTVEVPMSKGSAASHQAWETAKNRAVQEAEQRLADTRAKMYAQDEERLRALTDSNLSPGSARLFCLLVYAGWKKEFGGLYRDRVGAVMIDSRRLARLCGDVSVNALYHKTRPEKRDPATGQLIRKASETDGWIEELVKGGYIWIGKHRIPNIPPAKWPNVYNVCCHVPQSVTPSLPWADGNWGGEVSIQDDCLTVLDRDFSASDEPGNTEYPANTTGNHRNGGQPVTARGASPSPHAVIANHRNGGQPVTARGASPSPHAVIANHRNGGQPVPPKGDSQSVHPVQLRDGVPVNTVVPADSSKRLGNRAKAAKPPKRKDEPQYLELCRRVMGDIELDGKGDRKGNTGLWLTILRQDPQGAWKAMQDADEAKRTPTIARTLKTTWAKYAMDKYLSVFAAEQFRRRDYGKAAR